MNNMGKCLNNNLDEKKYQVLSMSTGSKCLAEKQLSLNGNKSFFLSKQKNSPFTYLLTLFLGSNIHDSHAEVLARRCFLRYIYNEMIELLRNKDHKSDALEIVEYSHVVEDFSLKKHFKIRYNVSFLLFTSHTPCRYMTFFFNSKSLSDF